MTLAHTPWKNNPVVAQVMVSSGVAGVVQVALQVDGPVGEELLAFAAGTLERSLELVLGQRHPEALPTSAARRLDR